MENRWSKRTPVKLDLVVHYGPLGLIRATSRDISKNGMFINTGRIVLSPEEHIEVTFNYPSAHDGTTYQMSATIVHSGEFGSGIEFVNNSLDDLETNDDMVTKRAASC